MHSRAYQPAQLNERAIYLRSVYIILAVLQSFWHLYYDNDHVQLPVTHRKPETPSDHGAHVVTSPFEQIKNNIVSVLRISAYRIAFVGFASPFIYWGLMRQFAWSWTVSFAKLLWNLPRSQSHATGIPPYHYLLILRSIYSGFLLMFMWESSNLLFTAFTSEEPLKLDKTLTEASKDPNGSLLSGLKAKKELTRTFAFWELMLISERFPERRKAIFDGLEREGGSTWIQILSASLEVIGGLKARIDASQKGAVDAAPETWEPVEIQTLPILTEPPKDDNIFLGHPRPTNKSEWVKRYANEVVKEHGLHPDWTSPVKQKAMSVIGNRRPSEHPTTLFYQRLAQLLRSPAGALFRKTFQRRAATVILGSPYSEVPLIIDAIDSITRLLICSLKEDNYGKVQADVPQVVRTFTSTINSIKNYLAETPPHWTDVYFEEEKEVPEDVKLVLNCLEDRLGELLSAFSLYLKDVGVTGEELVAAKEAAGGGSEMVQTGR
jgi:nucleoporin NDC1